MEAFHPRLRFVNKSKCLPGANRKTVAELSLCSSLPFGSASAFIAAVRRYSASLADFVASYAAVAVHRLQIAHVATEASSNRRGNEALSLSHSAA